MARKYQRAGVLLASAYVFLVSSGCRGRHEEAGTVTATRVPPTVVAARAADQMRAATELVNGSRGRHHSTGQILFGDLHVHSTFSGDAFWRSLPFVTGHGVGSPADACDFARFCADLDFWALTDHAETLSPAHWHEAAEAVRACNAAGGDSAPPDSVAFLGWEWTHASGAAEPDFGHRGVLLRETGADAIPVRPLSAPNRALQALREPETFWQRLRLPFTDLRNAQRYLDFSRYREELRDIPRCPSGRDVRALPADCQEVADTPAELLARLAQWDLPSLVVQQGTTGGPTHGPRPLTLTLDDAERQRLFEIYSGSGSAEEHRPWRAANAAADGDLECPAPTKAYAPCCWQAGEIVRRHCGAISAEACAERVRAAREAYLAHGIDAVRGQLDAASDSWLDCGQCRDCFNPAFMYRPEGSAQYLLALRTFEEPSQPRRARVGFIGGSDSHRGRPGTGYKEVQRMRMTDSAGLRTAEWRARLTDHSEEIFARLWGDDPDRAASFSRTGGLVALHADGRNRADIWAALHRREVYATSGDRILLWFDLLNGPEGPAPMGTQTTLKENPTFHIRAIGAPVQRPGCPETTLHAVGRERLDRLCGGECFHPSDERRVISRIEIVRIRPQQYPDEPVDTLIEDPWRRFPCPGDAAGCVIELEDPEFVASGRDAVYYVRAVQEPTAAINAGSLRCAGENGDCQSIRPCYADDRTPADDDCVALNEERAWSSPIYVDVAPVATEAD
jgi:hypothetical protein